ncbi:MAG TPA: PH domain-containing protein [Candidatus Dormibacteraeota bacterium]|nr:PH domain-containing protein [Candidatus Dormibacteraeota bacterium]
MAKDLLPGENLILKVHQHWIFIAKSLLLPVALIVLVVLADFTFISGIKVDNLGTFLTLGVVALALLWLIVVWIRWQSTSYTLTDQRIKIESGVLSRAEKIIPIDRIQDCTTRMSLVGRMLGYGRVEVDAAGAQGAEILLHLPNPGAFRDQVFVQSERRRGGPAAQQPATQGV